MSTRSAIFIPTETGEWICHYCHHDGYPEHMAAAVAAAKPEDILAAKELRGISASGEVEGYPDARDPERQETPEFPEWAEHAYILTAAGWRHATDQDGLTEAAAA